MRLKLQYAYSISVFAGVLVTAFLMMNREGNAGLAFRGIQTPVMRSEAGMGDPAVNSLFEVEAALSKMKKPAPPEESKTPTQRDSASRD